VERNVERRPVERVRGTQDLWPAEARALAAVRRQLEQTFTSFGYQPMDVPVLEPAELHLRKSGLEIISKLYSFEDQGGRQLCLRPELTASVVRAFVAQPPERLPVKIFTTGPVFRYERPSRGRYRQFTQCGVELIGAEGALADAEVIHLATQALGDLGLRDYRVTVGHVGVLGHMLAELGLTGRLRAFLLESLEDARRHGMADVRARLSELDPELFEDATSELSEMAELDESARDDRVAVRGAISSLLHQFGADALGRRRSADVVARMMDKLSGGSQRAAVERALAFIDRLGALRGAPAETLKAGRALLAEYGLAGDALDQLDETVGLLTGLGVDPARLEVDLGLSRGLQYYTGMVFEIDHAGLGSESQLCGGGRYDDLARALGSRRQIPALGFAFGVERVRLALNVAGRDAEVAASLAVLVVPAAPSAGAAAGRAAARLRTLGLVAQLDVSTRSLRAGLNFADREGFRYVAIVGEVEALAGTIRLRDMKTGAEQSVDTGDPAQVQAVFGSAGAGGVPQEAAAEQGAHHV
jgi:histidyl-tRNA synthetase